MAANDNDQVVVIRFWQEWEVKDLLAGWRARITHVNSGHLFYASGIDEAFAVVRSLLLAAKDGEPS